MKLETQEKQADLKVVAVIPAYETASRIEGVLKTIPREYFQHIILVDNHSQDGTFEVASRDKSVRVYRNDKNLGYGGNLKRGFTLALELGADVIVEIHSDGEYGLGSIGPAIEEIKRGAGLVLGNRFAPGLDPLKNGMYIWKYPFIKIMNVLCNLALGTHLGDLHQGFRVYSSALLKKIDFMKNDDNYLFGFEIIVQAVYYHFPIREVPQTCRYWDKKRGAHLKDSVYYTLIVFEAVVQFWLARLGFPTPLFVNDKKR